MNLAQIQIGLYDKLGYKNTPDGSIARRLTRYINQSHREVLTKKSMGKLRRKVLTFTSVANSPFCVLPQAAVRVEAIADRAVNRLLDEVTLQHIRASDPGLTFSSSIPYGYTLLNYASAVARDPSAAAAIYVVSDSASDGSGVSCSIEGTITGGYYRRATVAMNGTNPVNLSASISTWETITKFYLSGLASGAVTITEGSGGTELARIEPGRAYARYTTLHLTGTPSTARTYYADVELRLDDMIHPQDEPLILEDFHDILEAGALRHEYVRRKDIDQWKIEAARFSGRTAELQDFLTRPSGAANGAARRGQNLSQLGPWFPANS